jgi:hypothetical protein
VPNEPDEEPEFPLWQTLLIAILAWIALGVVIGWAVYWYW